MGNRRLYRPCSHGGRTALHWPLICVLLALLVNSASALPLLVPAPPPEPPVRPEIAHPREADSDFSRVADKLEVRLRDIRSAFASAQTPERRSELQSLLNEKVRVQLVFSRQITQKHIDHFLGLGGQIDYVFQAVSYGWNATLPLRLVEVLPRLMGDDLVAVVSDSPAQLHLDEATRTGRVRPLWVSGFAGSSSGFSGSSATTIGILDTGVDDSHMDLSGRMEYWKDWTSDNEPSPRDVGGHGSHVAGIALGTGGAAGATTSTLYYTDSGNMAGIGEGYFYPSPIHVPAGLYATLSSTATWVGGGTTSLYGLMRNNGSTSSYYYYANIAAGASPLTTSNSFNASSANQYTAGLMQNKKKTVAQYAIVNTVTYAGVGDGFNTFRGVAPGCRWAGVKVFTNSGTGSSLDIQQAVDDMVAQRVTHNVKVVNMSLGITGSPGIDTTLRTKVNSMVNNGIVAVASAGNDGPGTLGSNLIDDPGRAALAITVAANNDINQLTQYTSSGFSSPGSDEDVKPDVMAPGGSGYYSHVLSVDSNDADAELSTFADQRANDYMNISGTSMAAPFVAGAAALVIQALEQSGITWSFNSNAHPLLVKLLLCATCTESNAPREVSSGTNPTLGRAASPKDLYEGYGLLNPDAAVEAASITFATGTVTDSTGGGVFDRRAWARKAVLTGGTPVNLHLDVPGTGDFDLYVYSGTPDSKGNPVMRAYSTSAGSGTAENIAYTPTATETAYIVIKRVSGSGTWTLTGSTTGGDTEPPTPGTASSPTYATSLPIVVAYTGAGDTGGSGLKYVHLYYRKETGGTWSDSGLTSTGASGSFNFMAPAGDGTYYFDLRAEDNGGNWSPLPSGDGDDSTILDTSPPTTPVITDDGAYTASTSQVHAVWSASDATSGIAEYHCAVSATKLESGIITGGAWLSTGTTAQATRSGLMLTHGQVYYMLVKARDSAGLWSSIGVSDGITPVQNSAITVGAAKQMADLSTVGISGRVVTAVFSDHFYIEESGKSVGIRVNPIDMPTGIAIGRTIGVGGKIQTSGGERYIGPATATCAGTADVEALLIRNDRLGGGDWRYSALTGAGQKGIKDALDLNNIGLLVSTTGKVTYQDSEFFYIDDGSGAGDNSGYAGVKVAAAGLTIPAQNKQVKVTGISTCFQSGSYLYRQIRVRWQSDIAELN